MNKKNSMPNVTREVYKAVKKYDRQQFSDFCMSIYKSGFEDGRDSVPGIDVKKIFQVIADSKGIGPVKLAEIKANIEAAFGKGASECQE